MNKLKNIVIPGRHGRDILADLFYLQDKTAKDVVLFCHGYKGYKDWGAWDLVAEEFARQGYFFVKMNFSHNGGTIEQPIDFPDLEAFGRNNFIIELDDLETVIDWLHSTEVPRQEMSLKKMALIGHSRGGGIVLLKASEDHRVRRVVTWAGVSDFASRFPQGEQLELWQKHGVAHVHNGRTKQDMPHYFQFYETFKENEERLTIRKALLGMELPHLILHGDQDETVPLEEARALHSWSSNSELSILEGANHTFGSSQPWAEERLPAHLATTVRMTREFLGKFD